MKKSEKIEGTIENWESGKLGADEQYVRKVSPERQKEIDDVLGLQAISIRLPKDLIEQFKLIAKINGVGYQPLMRDALKRFAESEIKILLNRMASEADEQEKAAKEANTQASQGKHEKLAA